METLNVVLPLILYVCGIVLLIVLIILGLRLIKLLDKVERVVDNIENKVNSLNGIFSLIDKATDAVSKFSDNIISNVSLLVSKIFKKNKKKEEEFDYE